MYGFQQIALFPRRQFPVQTQSCQLCRRGNIFSRAHIALSPSDPAFWDFSWDEMANGDLPALTDYVLAATGHQKLGYVGGQLRSLTSTCNSC